jgi:hypothetical protein
MNVLVAEYLEWIESRIATATDAMAKADAEVDLAFCQLRSSHTESASLMLDQVFVAGRALAQPEQAKVLSVAMHGAGEISTQDRAH